MKNLLSGLCRGRVLQENHLDIQGHFLYSKDSCKIQEATLVETAKRNALFMKEKPLDTQRHPGQVKRILSGRQMRNQKKIMSKLK
jgi:hypothetical protein